MPLDGSGCLRYAEARLEVNFKPAFYCYCLLFQVQEGCSCKKESSMPYTISEAAARMHLSAPTLRYYDKEGLLPFVDRSASGVRVFKESA